MYSEKTTKNQNQVTIHSQVTLKGPTGKKIIKLVKPGEIDLQRLFVSVNSPFGQALINKKVGDVVTVHTPSKAIDYKIIEIA